MDYFGFAHLPSVDFNSADAQRSAVRAENAASRADFRVRELEARLDRALLALEAVWTFLRERDGLTETQLSQRVYELDFTDGKLDGVNRHPARPCAGCKRPVSGRFDRCLYCGHAMPRSPFA